ncbi:MAG TPA: NAD-binding protein [Methanomassiliicoccales archaeon]
MNRRLLYSISIFAGVLLSGTVAFTFVEPSVHENPLLSLYFTITTVFTVGYGDIIPTTDVSRFTATVVMVMGIAAGVSTLQSLFDLAIKRDLRRELGLPERRVRMKDHYIICGYGNVGREVLDQLVKKGEKYLVIENDRGKVEGLVEKGVPVISGDAESEEVLQRANISTAKGLIATMKDSQNMIVVLTAKTLNPKIQVVSEVEDHNNEAKLRLVGADSIVNCHEMGARLMVGRARHITIDPVCGQEISAPDAKFDYRYQDGTYHFCSKECMEAFKLNPERFKELRNVLDSTCGMGSR